MKISKFGSVRHWLAFTFSAALFVVFVHEAQAAKRSHSGSAKKAKAEKATKATTAKKQAADRALNLRTSITSLAAAEQQPALTSADTVFMDARRAFYNQDSGPLAQAAASLPDHPLADYPRFWQLSLAIRGASLSAATESAIEQYLSNSKNPLLIEQLRNEWITALVRRERWAEAIAQGQRLQARDDKAVQCHLWTAEIMIGGTLPVTARDYLLSPRELGEGCNPLLAAADARGQLTRDDLQRRLRLSAEAGAVATGRRTVALLAKDSSDFAMAFKAPGYLLRKGSRDTDALVMAVSLLARNEPEEAAQWLAAQKLPVEASQFCWAVIAAQGAQKLSPQSIEWVRRGIDAQVSDDTKAWMARSALAAGDWSLLNKILDTMTEHGMSDPAWIYWHARSFRELKRPERATPLLVAIAGQWHFYGHLAADELGMSITPPKEATPITALEEQQARNHPALTRALKLYALGLRLDGNREWNFALRGMNDRQLLAAADFACKASILDRCVNTADRTRSEHSMALRFLTPFRERMMVFAKEHGLDPAWVYGLIRQESRFLIDARSHVGAQGLMQIMPKTASWIARQLGHAGFTVRDLHDIDTNIRFGTYYLRDVANRLEQSEVMASAAYNAGPGRPARWRQALNSAMDGAAFAEIIPFNETRDYVKKVLWNATWYSAIFEGKPQSLKARLGSISPRAEKITREISKDPGPDEGNQLAQANSQIAPAAPTTAPTALLHSTDEHNVTEFGERSRLYLDDESEALAEPIRFESFTDSQ